MKILNHDRDHMAAIHKAAELNHELGNESEALALAEKMVDECAGNVKLQFFLARIYHSLGQSDRTQYYLEQTLNVDRSNISVLRYLSDFLRIQGNLCPHNSVS